MRIPLILTIAYVGGSASILQMRLMRPREVISKYQSHTAASVRVRIRTHCSSKSKPWLVPFAILSELPWSDVPCASYDLMALLPLPKIRDKKPRPRKSFQFHRPPCSSPGSPAQAPLPSERGHRAQSGASSSTQPGLS